MSMKMCRTIAAGVALLAPAFVSAQETPPPAEQPQEVELASYREVFEYPSFTRRNPFRAQSAAEGGGPRFEQLSLTGIMWDSDPSWSVATVTTGGVAVNPDGTLSPIEGDAYSVKVGQTIGNTTIREIQRDRVIVDVEEFGLVERRTMTIVSRRQGGSQ